MRIYLWAIGLMVVIWSLPAYGWGLKAELQTPRVLAASLTAKALRQHAIRVCLAIAPDDAVRFPSNSLREQITAALRLWLLPIENAAAITAGIDFVSCDRRPDLQVTFGATQSGDSSNGAFSRYVAGPVPADDFMEVKVDTDYVWHETRGLAGNPNGSYRWQDFAAFVPRMGQKNLVALMRVVSNEQRLSLDDFAARTHLPHSAVFWTTYRVFIHEFCHAFGLCDTVSTLFAQQCDPNYRSSEAQSGSVMRDSNFFYLTDDDRLGLAAMVWRVQH